MIINKKTLKNIDENIDIAINDFCKKSLLSKDVKSITNLTISLTKHCVEFLIFHDLYIYVDEKDENSIDKIKNKKDVFREFVLEYVRDAYEYIFDDIVKKLDKSKEFRKIISDNFKRKYSIRLNIEKD